MRETRIYFEDTAGDAAGLPFTGQRVCDCGGEVVYRPGVERRGGVRFGACIECGKEYSGRETASSAPSMLLD